MKRLLYQQKYFYDLLDDENDPIKLKNCVSSFKGMPKKYLSNDIRKSIIQQLQHVL